MGKRAREKEGRIREGRKGKTGSERGWVEEAAGSLEITCPSLTLDFQEDDGYILLG